MKRVLIITYYWPPSGGVGVQRWLKFSKYLPGNGWLPVVYVPENPEYPAIDDSLKSQVAPEVIELKTPIWEPYSWYKKFSGKKKTSKIGTAFTGEKKQKSLVEKVSRWVRGNLFLPDARKFWVKPSVKYLSEYIRENQIDAIISTGTPHSMHLIALGLKNEFNLTWIADFRDPWSEIFYSSEMFQSEWALNKQRKLEKSVLENADYVLTVGNQMKVEFSKIVSPEKIHVIPNGFDSEDFKSEKTPVQGKFIVAHFGSFPLSRDVENLWVSISELINENKEFAAEFELHLVGHVDDNFHDIFMKNGLSNYVKYIGYKPHQEVAEMMTMSHMLLLIINIVPKAELIISGKVFEYLKSQRPTLTIGPKHGELDTILKQVNAAEVISYEDKNEMKRQIMSCFTEFKNGETVNSYTDISRFDREVLTENIVALLNR